jgi:hypothetical protein
MSLARKSGWWSSTQDENLTTSRVTSYTSIYWTNRHLRRSPIHGDISLSGNVCCGGKRIAITLNCESMLRCLRRQGRNRILWVDAISIDQQNTLERNHQVRLMASIYSNASQVVAYVCPRHPHAKGADGFDRIMEYLENHSNNLGNNTRSPSRGQIATFLALPYFNRVWVSVSYNKTYTPRSNSFSCHEGPARNRSC